MFPQLVCLIFLSALIAGTPVLQRGRIVGGIPVDVKDYPYQVSLDIAGHHICGGVIISESFVISAANCIYGWDYYDITVRVNTSILEEGGTLHLVKNRHVYPGYCCLDYDISVLELEEPLTFGDGVQPIRLPESGEQLENRTLLTIFGWGSTSEDDRLQSPQLRAVNVTSYTNEECQVSYDPMHLPVTDRMICGNVPEGGRNSCKGDGGGPVVHDGVVYGLVSWAKGCAEAEYPAVYSRVAHPSMREFVKNIEIAWRPKLRENIRIG